MALPYTPPPTWGDHSAYSSSPPALQQKSFCLVGWVLFWLVVGFLGFFWTATTQGKNRGSTRRCNTDRFRGVQNEWLRITSSVPRNFSYTCESTALELRWWVSAANTLAACKNLLEKVFFDWHYAWEYRKSQVICHGAHFWQGSALLGNAKR